MIGKALQPEIAALVVARDFATLRDVLVDWEPEDVAELLSELAEQHDGYVIFPTNVGLDQHQAAFYVIRNPTLYLLHIHPLGQRRGLL